MCHENLITCGDVLGVDLDFNTGKIIQGDRGRFSRECDVPENALI